VLTDLRLLIDGNKDFSREDKFKILLVHYTSLNIRFCILRLGNIISIINISSSISVISISSTISISIISIMMGFL
jgi:hypothetical protein